MRWVGLDVHANASIVAVFDDVTGEVITRRVSGRPLEVLDVLHPLARPLRAVYRVKTDKRVRDPARAAVRGRRSAAGLDPL